MNNWIQEKLLPKILWFVNTRPVTAVKEGMIYTIPLIIVGSVALILSNFPVPAVVAFLSDHGLIDILNQAYMATFNINAIIAVLGISYQYILMEKQEPLGGAVIALGSFLIFQPSSVSVTNDAGEVIGTVSNVINRTWTAGQGMIGAIICGLLVGYIYSWFLKKNIRIKMPAGVPVGVTNAFSALVPAFVIISGATVLHGVCDIAAGTTVIEQIYSIIQIPLQSLTDSFGAIIIYAFIVSFLWFFGVHGATIMSGIMQGILQANYLDNQAILDTGLELTKANGGHIVTQQFIELFVTATGSGITIGIVLYMVALAKSKQFKALGKISVVPGIFNINEPILFGLPIVMNPLMAVPFILTPIVVGIIEYVAIAAGLCPMYSGVYVPWTTPPIISGLIAGGWRTALLQVVMLVVSFVIYLPFVRKLDLAALENEKAAAESEDDDEDW